MKDMTVHIEGMSCRHCVMRVKKAVEEVGGVSASDVNIGSARVSYDESRVQETDIEAAIEKAGYRIKR